MTWEEETIDARKTPADLIRMHGCLRDAVEPLVALLSVQPLTYRVAIGVVELAMAMGIHAAQRTAAIQNEPRKTMTFGPWRMDP